MRSPIYRELSRVTKENAGLAGALAASAGTPEPERAGLLRYRGNRSSTRLKPQRAKLDHTAALK
jgi:hypothetical protein